MEDQVTDETIVKPTDSVIPEEPKPDVVARGDHERAINDMKKYKARVVELEDQAKSNELKEMKAREDWQKIAELKEQEAIEAREELKLTRSTLAHDKKISAIRQAAIAKGIRKDAINDLDFLDFDEVQLETTSTGRINVLGADTAVDRLKTLKPHWFGSKTSSINGSSPEVNSGGAPSMKEIREAQKKAKETGDYAPYEKLLRQFQAQSRR